MRRNTTRCLIPMCRKHSDRGCGGACRLGGLPSQIPMRAAALIRMWRSIRRIGLSRSCCGPEGRRFEMADRTGAGGTVFGGGPGQLGVAVAAERVEGRFRGTGQVGPRLAVAVDAATDARFVDKVVMAGDAVDCGVFFVREVDR